MATMSRMTAAKRAIIKVIISALVKHYVKVGQKLDLLMAGSLPPGVKMQVMLSGLGNTLQTRMDELEEADRRLVRMRVRNRRARKKLERAVGQLREALIKQRKSIQNHWGNEVAIDLGFDGSTPTNVEELVNFALTIAESLGEDLDDYELKESEGYLSSPPDPDKFIAALEERAALVNQKSVDCANAKRNLQEARYQRDQAIVAWKLSYSNIAAIIEKYFRLAGMKEQADRVRPTTRRRRGLPEAEELAELEEMENDPETELYDEEEDEDEVDANRKVDTDIDVDEADDADDEVEAEVDGDLEPMVN